MISAVHVEHVESNVTKQSLLAWNVYKLDGYAMAINESTFPRKRPILRHHICSSFQSPMPPCTQ